MDSGNNRESWTSKLSSTSKLASASNLDNPSQAIRPASSVYSQQSGTRSARASTRTLPTAISSTPQLNINPPTPSPTASTRSNPRHPSSVYSQPSNARGSARGSTRTLPGVSPLSSTPQLNNIAPPTPSPTASIKSTRRPPSFAFFDPQNRKGRAGSTSSVSPFPPRPKSKSSASASANDDDDGPPGGYDGAYDRMQTATPPVMMGRPVVPANLVPHPYSEVRRSGQFGGGGGEYEGGSGGGGYSIVEGQGRGQDQGQGKDAGKDKGKKKERSKSYKRKHHGLKVDAANMSMATKMGVFLMGTTPKKLERTARDQSYNKMVRKEKRAEKKRQKATEAAGGGSGGEQFEGEGDD